MDATRPTKGFDMPMKAAHYEHRLNQPCPDCADPMWLHTDRCLKLTAAGRFTVTQCGCPRTAKDFAA